MSPSLYLLWNYSEVLHDFTIISGVAKDLQGAYASTTPNVIIAKVGKEVIIRYQSKVCGSIFHKNIGGKYRMHGYLG